jgi:hypothetical protein
VQVCRLEVDFLSSVIPVQTGIQAAIELEAKKNLDAGLRRHDETLFA